MESCNTCLGANLAFAERRLSMDNIPQLPDQVGTPDFTRLRDLPANVGIQSILLLSTTGKVNGESIGNPLNSINAIVLSSDPLWIGQILNTTTIKIIGPPGETFTGIMAILQPQIAN